MLVENEEGGKGTGFLVRSNKTESNEGKVFLITNKHVLNSDREKRDKARRIALHLNIQNENSIVKQKVDIPTNIGSSKSFREHPSEDVDVIAFDITELFVKYPSIKKETATYEMLLTPDKIKDWDIKIGDQINVIGYPKGIEHRMTNFPIIRSGIISSMIGEELQDEVESLDGTLRKRNLRGFLVDGAIIPGSSGPVVLPPVSVRNVHGGLQIQTFSLLLLGIIAESRYAPLITRKGDFLSFSGLGLAFDAQTIKETIDLFFI